MLLKKKWETYALIGFDQPSKYFLYEGPTPKVASRVVGPENK
jgi:hypothetical protein